MALKAAHSFCIRWGLVSLVCTWTVLPQTILTVKHGGGGSVLPDFFFLRRTILTLTYFHTQSSRFHMCNILLLNLNHKII